MNDNENERCETLFSDITDCMIAIEALQKEPCGRKSADVILPMTTMAIRGIAEGFFYLTSRDGKWATIQSLVALAYTEVCKMYDHADELRNMPDTTSMYRLVNTPDLGFDPDFALRAAKVALNAACTELEQIAKGAS